MGDAVGIKREKEGAAPALFFYYTSLAAFLGDTSSLSLHDIRVKTRAFKFTLLSQILGVPVTPRDLMYSPRGKPFFRDIPDFSFNISHSKEYYLIAWVQQKTDLGADIEDKKRIIKRRAYPRIFSPEERERLAEEDDPQAAAIQLWTRKEAFIKARALGIWVGLKELEFTPTSGESLFRARFDGNIYRFWPVSFAHQVGSICVADLTLSPPSFVALEGVG